MICNTHFYKKIFFNNAFVVSPLYLLILELLKGFEQDLTPINTTAAQKKIKS